MSHRTEDGEWEAAALVMRPPMPFAPAQADLLLETLDGALAHVERDQ